MMNEMKGRTATTLFCIAVGILIFVLITTKDSFRIEMGKEEPLVMNRQEKQFVENHNSITLHVDKDLHYLGIDFLQEYIQMIMNPTGLKVKLSEGNPKHMDGSIQIVTDQLRKQVGDIYFSAPVIQTSGSMFVRKELLHDRESKTILDGVMIQDYLTTHQLKTLSYNGRGISVNAVGSAKEAVTLADKEGMDCIIGNQEAIVYELRKQNLQDKFIDTDSNFRTQNVSIVTGKQKPQLAGLINQCVQKADKELLLLYAEEKHGNRPSRLLEENRYGNMAVLLSIIISAVFITFSFIINPTRIYIMS